mgnify:CR=1 FL=1
MEPIANINLRMDQIREETKRISGRTLEEYLRASRKGASFALNRKQRRELFHAVKMALRDPEWASYLTPGGGCLSHLNGIENKIHAESEEWFMDT